MMLLANLVVAAFTVLALRSTVQTGTTLIKQLCQLELIWICILLMTGLYFTFGTLEVKNSSQTFAEAAGAETMRTFYALVAFLMVHMAITGTFIWHVFMTRNK